MEALFQILRNFPEAVLSGILLSGSLITLVYLIFWKKYKPRFKKYRIQIKERVDDRQIRREISNSVFVFIVGALFSSVVIYLSSRGYTQIYTRFYDHNPLLGMAGLFLLLIIDDTWFYWVHRLLHHPKLFPYIHVVHHKSIDVNPFTSLSFHWAEPFLLTLWIFPVAFLLPVYAPVLGIIQVWGLLNNIKSHLGYELYPAGFNKSWLRFMTTSTHHNMHHSKFKGNYGVHFRFWDRLLGTELENYENEYSRIKQRTSIPPEANDRS